MSNPVQQEDIIRTIIGEDASFHGEFHLDGSIRIDGRFSGVIQCKAKVVVGEGGYVKTNIHARDAVIRGVVEGNIHVLNSVHLISGSRVLGDIIAGNLIVDDGVEFQGRAKIQKILQPSG